MNALPYIIGLLTVLYGAIIFIFILALRRPQQPTNGRRCPVSVIVAARNEERSIGSLLQDLIKQDYPAELYEVIVANDGSTDRTADIVSALAARCPRVHLLDIHETPAGFSPKKYALQCAVESSRGEIILATDADCRVGAKWISTMVRYFNPDVGFVIGFSQFGQAGQAQKLVERFQAFDFVTLMGVAAASTHLGVPLAASGQNLGYRRSAFDRVNGYRTISRRVSGDDVLLMQMIRKHTDCSILFASDPDSYVVSAPQPTWADFINQRNRWASNGGYQLHLNPLFFAYLLLTFSCNLALLTGVILYLSGALNSPSLLICLAAKGWFEYGIARSGCRYFQRCDLLRCFPLWFLLQIPYVVVVGVMGSLGLFRWKGRRGATEIKR
ncbi:MAG: Beta-monoglucosyldiacylglycerol synthase [bacterium ADurb.Bin478]|nr:MAG: Beta-monoglucosyldiacylglycerol synthase [bacterium ADurb.Bin478]